MVNILEYKKYFGASTAPQNFERLKYLSLNTIKSNIAKSVPTESCPCYEDFKKALLEQINFYDINSDLIINESTDGYTLGSYSESASNKRETFKSIDRLSPMAYEILLNCGLIQSSLGGCCYD